MWKKTPLYCIETSGFMQPRLHVVVIMPLMSPGFLVLPVFTNDNERQCAESSQIRTPQ